MSLLIAGIEVCQALAPQPWAAGGRADPWSEFGEPLAAPQL